MRQISVDDIVDATDLDDPADWLRGAVGRELKDRTAPEAFTDAADKSVEVLLFGIITTLVGVSSSVKEPGVRKSLRVG